MSVMWLLHIIKKSKIITREQRRSRIVREYFLQELIDKPVRMLAQVFDIMKVNKMICDADTSVLAEEYSSYIVYLYFEQNFIKEALSLREIERKMRRHNDFYDNYVLKESDCN